MTTQGDLPKSVTTEHVLVIGTAKLWDEWVWEQRKSTTVNSIYNFKARTFETIDLDGGVIRYYFVSSNNMDGEIIQWLTGREFHRWCNLGVQVSPEVRCHIRTRCRLTQENTDDL